MNPSLSITAADLANFACEHLPEGWEVVARFEYGCGSVSLYDPDGNVVEYPSDDMNMIEMVQSAVNFARDADGLEPLNFDGSQRFDDLEEMEADLDE